MKPTLTKEEQVILRSFESGEWKSVDETKAIMKQYRQWAQETIRLSKTHEERPAKVNKKSRS